MEECLVVVESPAKAKTIEKYLGGKCRVLATYGHIKDLPERDLGIDIKNDFAPSYQLTPKAKKFVTELKKAAKEAKSIFIASDPDREGEAIAFHVAEELPGLKKKIKRVLFFEVTKNAILKAFEHPYELDSNKYDAQKSRRVLDRLVGYKISPLLWRKVRWGLSAGRVQSVALMLVCQREKEIKDFVPVEYWSIKAAFSDKEKKRVQAKLEEIEGKKVEIKNKEAADSILQQLSKCVFYLRSIIEKPKKRSAPVPFITSTLQQDGVRRLNFSTKRTMIIAQMLYEGVELGDLGRQGLITYMRTDSPRISPEAIDSARKHILSKYGKEYLSNSPRQFEGKKSAQEAHECIRPTDIQLEPDRIKDYLNKEQYLMYKMIYDRFTASQMKDAEFSQTIYEIEDEKEKKFLFRVKGLTLKFAGFLAAYMDKEEASEQGEEKEGKLPALKDKAKLVLSDPVSEQHFTSPPPRYTEATLVKELEEDGIGRPSTYASIISTLLDKEYVKLSEGKFYTTDLGCTVSDLVVKGFPDIINVDFTAAMEAKLDAVEEGKNKWNKIVADFYETFVHSLEKARKSMENLRQKGIETDVKCELCGSGMVIKSKNKNEFLACSGYPKCKNIKSFHRDKTGKVVVANTKTDKKCPKCDGALIVKRGPYSNFLACEKYPACKYTESITSGVSCPQNCGGFLIERRTKKKRIFYGCSKYPECNFIMNQKPVNEKCPQCGHPFLIEAMDKRVPVLKCINKDCGFKKIN